MTFPYNKHEEHSGSDSSDQQPTKREPRRESRSEPRSGSGSSPYGKPSSSPRREEKREDRPRREREAGASPYAKAPRFTDRSSEKSGGKGEGKPVNPYAAHYKRKPSNTEKRVPNPSRDLALRLLFEAAKPTSPGLDHFLAQAAEKNVSEADRRLARLLACGVLQKQKALKRLLDSFLEEPLKEKPAIELSMLLGFEQLLFTERIPAHAIVDETVRLVEAQAKGISFKGLANAVMRRASEQVETLRERFNDFPWTDRYSVPPAIAELTEPVFTYEADHEAFWHANNDRAPLCIRVRGTLTLSEALEILTEQCPQLPWGELDSSVVISEDPAGLVLPASFGGIVSSQLFLDGKITVEDRGAQIAATIAAPDEHHHRLLDLCSSPGGKASHWVDLLPKAHLTASDVSDSKLRRLNETLGRLRINSRVRPVLVEELLNNMPADFFDAVLVDAPCSGIGTLRRHPEIRLRRSLTSVLSLQETQLEILEQAYFLLKPGGILSYVVCTLTLQETLQVAAHFEALHPDLVAAGPSPFARDFAHLYALPETPYYRTTPHQHGCDGFFIARWRKGM